MSTSLDRTLNEAAGPIASCERPLLIGHVRADLDCIGSLAGLAAALRDAGKQPAVGIQKVLVPPRLLHLFEWAEIQPEERPDPSAADLVIVLDTSVTSRLNIHCGIDGLAGKPIVVIDHHVTNERYGQWNHVRFDASSTCEIVVELLDLLNWPITPTIATMLYAGIHGDTDGFSLPNTTPRSLHVAARLAEAGAEVSRLCQRMYRSKTRSEFELLRLVYRNTRISEDGRVTWSTADHEQILAAGCNHADIDDQVAIPRLLEGADIAILFTEGLKDSIRINLRSEGEVDLLPLAKEFGGGGHPNAAGTSIKRRPFDEVVPEVTSRAIAYLAERYPR